MASIVIKRDKGWADKLRGYKIFLNDEERGLLKQGEEIELNVEPGLYEIFGKISWCKTKKIKFEIKNNEDRKSFLIYSNLRGIKIWLNIIYAILGIYVSGMWIKMKEN